MNFHSSASFFCDRVRVESLLSRLVKYGGVEEDLYPSVSLTHDAGTGRGSGRHEKGLICKPLRCDRAGPRWINAVQESQNFHHIVRVRGT